MDPEFTRIRYLLSRVIGFHLPDYRREIWHSALAGKLQQAENKNPWLELTRRASHRGQTTA